MDQDKQSPPKSPSDEEIVAALQVFRQHDPDLGRSKVLLKLKDENDWTCSDLRLKNLMAKHGLGNNMVKASEPIAYPKNALAAQERYKEDSIRCFKLYSRGPYDFGVTPNSDQAIKISIIHNRLVKFGRPKTAEAKAVLASAWPMQAMWEFYWAAAQKAGIAKEDVGHQLEAEYGVNPIPFLPPAPTQEQIEARKVAFKKESLKLKREMLKMPEARTYIPVDKHGEPVWDEKINGEFALIVAKIDKGNGLTEFGSV